MDYYECGGCEKKCGGLNALFCPNICKPPGCYCKQDYFRADSICVPAGQCPSMYFGKFICECLMLSKILILLSLACSRNHEIYNCGVCDIDCGGKKVNCTQSDTCSWGCHCESGYFRSSVNGACVTKEQCKSKFFSID